MTTTKGQQSTTGTVHYAVRQNPSWIRSGEYTHLVPVCGLGRQTRHSLFEVSEDTPVTCQKCLSGMQAKPVSADKAAKLLVEPVEAEYNCGRIETVAGAKQEIRDCIRCNTFYGDESGRYGASISRMVAALLAKGVEQAEIDTIIERATKKAQKEAGK